MLADLALELHLKSKSRKGGDESLQAQSKEFHCIRLGGPEEREQSQMSDRQLGGPTLVTCEAAQVKPITVANCLVTSDHPRPAIHCTTFSLSQV